MREDDKNITGYDEPMRLNFADEQMALSNADEQMLQAFFADQQEEIPDDGFSQRVMKKIPTSTTRHLERCWQVACLVLGMAFIVSTQLLTSLQDSLFASKVAALMMLSKITHVLSETLLQPQQLLMMIGAGFVVLCVWGYNKVLDARIEM